MRVTKIIKEYVEKAVKEIYNPLIENCSKDYDKNRKEVEKILEKMTDEFDAAAKKVIKEHGFSINTSWNEKENSIIQYTCDFGKEEYRPIVKKREKLRDEEAQKIQDILINLELGGTKAELDEMLRALKNATEEVAV